MVSMFAALVLIICVSSVDCKQSSSDLIPSRPASDLVLSGLPRGGWRPPFGRFLRDKGRNRSSGGDDDDDGGGNGGKMYPALSKEEIMQVLHVPVFAITDMQGNGAVLSQPNDNNGGENVVYFFLSQKMAEMALSTMQAANKGVDLKISALDLGKVWFKILENDDVNDNEFEMTKVGLEAPIKRRVSMRLVPELRDLVGARLLQGIDPDDVPKLHDAMQNDPGTAREMIRKAMEKSSDFNQPYNKIPVFMVSQLRMQQKGTSGEGFAPGSVVKFPMFLSPKTMLQVYANFVKNTPGGEDLEPTLQLGELHKIVEMMQHESDMDFRNVVLLPGGLDEDGNGGGGGDDDDNDGGDGGIERGDDESEETEFDDFEVTPYIEMGVFETPTGAMTSGGPELVPLGH